MSDEQAVSREIKAGDTTYTIASFKGYKAFRIGRMLAGMGEIGPEISKAVNKFIAEYRETNADVIPRATLEFRYPEDAAVVSEEAWKESGGEIRLAREPNQAEILAIVLPTAFELAGDRVADLLAWVVADDAKLEEKDGEGAQAVDEYIGELRKNLLFRSGIDEMFDLAVAAQEVLKDQMEGQGEAARSLLALIGLDAGDEEEAEEETSDQTDETPKAASPEFEPEKNETPSIPESPTTSEKPDSSTDSPPPTDGDEETSSTGQRGEPSPSISG